MISAGTDSKISGSATISGRELALIVGAPAAEIRGLASDGRLPKKGRDVYPTSDAVRAYCDILRSRAKKSADPDIIADELQARVFKLRQQGRKEKHLADAAGRRARLLSGHSLDRDLVQSAMIEIVSTVRSKLLAMPTAYAQQLSDAQNPRETFSILTEAIHEALSELARGISKETIRAIHAAHLARVREKPLEESTDNSDADEEGGL